LLHRMTCLGEDRAPEARGRVIDHRMLCSEAVYEGQESVHFFGLYVHLSCYRKEADFPNPATDHRSSAAA